MPDKHFTFVAGSSLYRLDNTTSPPTRREVYSGLTKGEVYSFVTMNNVMYGANGVDDMFAWDGRAGKGRKAGIEAPAGLAEPFSSPLPSPTPSGAGNYPISGGELIGTYSWRVAFLNDRDGFVVSNPTLDSNQFTTLVENDAYAFGTVTVEKNKTLVQGAGTSFQSSMAGAVFSVDGDFSTYVIDSVDVGADTLTLKTAYYGEDGAGVSYKIRGNRVTLNNIPTSTDPQVTKRRIYRTDGVDPVSYYFLADIDNNTDTVYTDNTSDDNLGALVQTADVFGNLQFTDATPPKAGILAVYKSRMYASGDVDHPNRLYYSETFLPESWGPQSKNFISIDRSDGDEITGLASLPNVLVVFKRDSIYALTGDSPDNFQVRKISDDAGCVSHNSIVNVGGILLWVGEDNIYSFDGGSVKTMADHIRPTLRGLNKARERNIVGAQYSPRGQVWWSVSSEGSSTHDKILVLQYEKVGRTNQTVWTIFDIKAEALTEVEDVDDRTEIVHADAYGNLWRNDVGFNDGGFEGLADSGSPSGGTTTTMTVSGNPFPTANGGLSGALLRFISGPLAGEESIIDSNTSNTLTLKTALSAPPDPTPVTGDVYLIAPIRCRIKTAHLDFGVMVNTKRLYWVHTQVGRDNESTGNQTGGVTSEFTTRVYQELSASAVREAKQDLSKAFVRVETDVRARFHQFEFEEPNPNQPCELVKTELQMAPKLRN